MQVRLETVTVSDDVRRAVRFVTTKKRTKATRDEVRDYLEGKLAEAIADLEYRWNGGEVRQEENVEADNTSTVTPADAVALSEERNEERANTEVVTDNFSGEGVDRDDLAQSNDPRANAVTEDGSSATASE